ncbi:MAG: hypothetical protein AAFY71_22670 [Bacteroidota bacterium]
MSTGTFVKLCTWLSSIVVMGFFIALPSCTHTSEGSDQKTLTTIDRNESSVIKPIKNDGWLHTRLLNNTLYLTFQPLGNEKIDVIRIYDANGGLKFIEKEPRVIGDTLLRLDCSYYDKGEYLIVAYLDNGQFIEEYIQLS